MKQQPIAFDDPPPQEPQVDELKIAQEAYYTLLEQRGIHPDDDPAQWQGSGGDVYLSLSDYVAGRH